MSVEHRGTKALELWTRRVTEGYPGVNVTNMTTSWRDGLAFCALIHHFRPDLIDIKSLKSVNILENNALAFRVAEQHLGIPALLDAEDMVQTEIPDRLSILTYVSQFYQAFSALGLIGPGGRRSPISPNTNVNNTKNSSPAVTSPTKATVNTSNNKSSPIVSTTPRSKTISQPPATLQTKTETGFKTDKVAVGARVRREECVACHKQVFLAERIVVGFPGQLRHRTCFRCDRCSGQLTLASYYETEKGQFCCETCPDEERNLSSGDDEEPSGNQTTTKSSADVEGESSFDSESDSDLTSSGNSDSDENSLSSRKNAAKIVTPPPPSARTIFLNDALNDSKTSPDQVVPPPKPPRSDTQITSLENFNSRVSPALYGDSELPPTPNMISSGPIRCDNAKGRATHPPEYVLDTGQRSNAEEILNKDNINGSSTPEHKLNRPYAGEHEKNPQYIPPKEDEPHTLSVLENKAQNTSVTLENKLKSENVSQIETHNLNSSEKSFVEKIVSVPSSNYKVKDSKGNIDGKVSEVRKIFESKTTDLNSTKGSGSTTLSVSKLEAQNQNNVNVNSKSTSSNNIKDNNTNNFALKDNSTNNFALNYNVDRENSLLNYGSEKVSSSNITTFTPSEDTLNSKTEAQPDLSSKIEETETKGETYSDENYPKAKLNLSGNKNDYLTSTEIVNPSPDNNMNVSKGSNSVTKRSIESLHEDDVTSDPKILKVDKLPVDTYLSKHSTIVDKAPVDTYLSKHSAKVDKLPIDTYLSKYRTEVSKTTESEKRNVGITFKETYRGHSSDIVAKEKQVSSDKRSGKSEDEIEPEKLREGIAKSESLGENESESLKTSVISKGITPQSQISNKDKIHAEVNVPNVGKSFNFKSENSETKLELKVNESSSLNVNKSVKSEEESSLDIEERKNTLEPSIEKSEITVESRDECDMKPVSRIETEVSFPKTVEEATETQKSEYPDELNPFGSEEEKEKEVLQKRTQNTIPSERNKENVKIRQEHVKKKVKTKPFNPFDTDEEEEEEEKGRGNADQIPQLETKKNKKSLNPFWSDDESDNDSASSTPSKSKAKPPRPPPPTLRKDPTSTHKKYILPSNPYEQKVLRDIAPPSPSPSTRSSSSDQSTLRLKKKTRQAPAPPPVGSVTNLDKLAPLQGVNQTEIPEGDDALKEKMEKDFKNHTSKMRDANQKAEGITSVYRGGITTPKSEKGEWRRKKGPAPSRPVPQKRAIRKLPMRQVAQELQDIEVKQTELERQGVLLETAIRDRTEGPPTQKGINSGSPSPDDSNSNSLNSTSPNSETDKSYSSITSTSSLYPPIEVEDMILQLFELVNEKNELFRRQTELMYLKREKRLEEEHAELEYQIRCLMLKPPSEKNEDDEKIEEELIARLLKVVEQRDAVVNCLEMERQREAIEDESIATQMIKYQEKHIDGIESDDSKERVKKKKKKLRSLMKKKKKGKDKEKSQKVDADKDVDETEVKIKKKKKKNWFKKSPLPDNKL